MDSVVQYQINQTKKKIRKMMIDDPKLRKKYAEQRRLNKIINDLEIDCLNRYWFNK